MVKLYTSKQYEKFVIDSLIAQIGDGFDLTKKQARVMLFNALAYNTVVEEIFEKIDYLKTREVVNAGE